MTSLHLHRFGLTPRQGIRLLNGLLLLALLFSLWRWVEVLSPASVHYQRPAPETRNTGTRPANTVAVSKLHLFGRHDARAITNKALPKSQLKLSLQGTLMAPERKQRRAFIADAKGNQQSYAEQDELPGGAKLLEIRQDHVVLLRNGIRETLNMSGGGPQSTALAADPATISAYQGGPLKQPPPIPGIRRTGAPNVTLNNTQLSVSQLKLDPQQLAQQVHAMPVRKNGKVVGYRLRAGRYAAVLQRMGIRPQDVITEINGQSLSDPAAALMLMNNLQQSGPIQLTIERDGQPQTVTIDLDS